MIKDFFSKEEPKFKPKIEMFNKDLKIVVQDAEMERNKEFKKKINKKLEEIDQFFIKIPGNIFEMDEERKNKEIKLISTINDKNNKLLEYLSTQNRDNSSRIDKIIGLFRGIKYCAKDIDENTRQKEIEDYFKDKIDKITEAMKNIEYNLSQYWGDFCDAIDALNDFNGKTKVGREIKTFSDFGKEEKKEIENLKDNIEYYANNANLFRLNPNTWWNYLMCLIDNREKMIKVKDFLETKCKDNITGIDQKLENYNKQYYDYFKEKIKDTLQRELIKNYKDIDNSNQNIQSNESIIELIEKKKKYNEEKISEWNEMKKKFENLKNKIISI
jgi:DNA repair exonuclease SbcCD ATPase subunit